MYSASNNLVYYHTPNPFLLAGSTQSGPGCRFAATLFFHSPLLRPLLPMLIPPPTGAQRVRTQAISIR